MLLSVAVERAPGIVVGRRDRAPSHLRIPEQVRHGAKRFAQAALIALATVAAVPPFALFATMVLMPVAPVLLLATPFALIGMRGDPASARRRRRRRACRAVPPRRRPEEYPLPLQGLARLAASR